MEERIDNCTQMAEASAARRSGLWWTPGRIGRWAMIVGLVVVIAVVDSIGRESGVLVRASLSTQDSSGATTITTATTTATTTTPSMTMKSWTEIDGERFMSISGRAGFWRVGRTVDDTWWFISPDDRVEFMNTVTTVQPFQLGRRAAGPHYASADWNGGFDTSSGDLNAWAQATLVRVRAMGFKGLGAWCHPVFHSLDVPITRDLNIWAHAAGDARLLYHPDWPRIARAAIERQVVPLRDNKNLVGYYLDNELDWNDSGAGPGRYFDNLPPDDPNRQKVIEVIRRLWPELEEFNSAWGLDINSWEMLAQMPVLPHEPPEAYGKLFSAWLEQLALDYFKMTCEQLRGYDPNHLILGVRFKGNAPIEVVRAHRGLTDAVSLNYYVSDAKLDPDMFPMIVEEAQQPLIITEYSFHSLDGRSGNRNTFGFAAQVLDQEARAEGYKLFTQRLARVPYVIGADWFQWSDEPPSGRTADGEDVNFGVVDIDDRPYETLAAAIKSTTATLNELHRESHSELRSDVFREGFTQRPRVDVPYLSTPLRINGELSDWPAESRLVDMHHSQTLGSERSPLPLPEARVGWNEKGLYFGIEVFDRDIEGAPADGWWWTRDSVELFVSTRLPEESQNFYTPHERQFFFVPIAFPGTNGNSGVVGQWNRPGDGLDGPKVPQPLIQEASRVFPDRYVVEIFIPAEVMHGFDATGQTRMALNIYAKNFQNAIEYFWSAPKQVQMQVRPGSWGEMRLIPRATASGQ